MNIKATIERLKSQIIMAETLLDYLVDDPGCGQRYGLKPDEFLIGDFIIRDTKQPFALADESEWKDAVFGNVNMKDDIRFPE